MIRSLLNKIVETEKLTNPGFLQDADGPGTGNGAIMHHVERPKEGGILTYLYYYKYPYKGYPEMNVVLDIHLVKKILHYAIQSAYKAKKTTQISLLLLFILPKWLVGGLREVVIDYFYGLIEWKLYLDVLKPERYCPCVRELYRTFTAVINREKDKSIQKLITFIRDIFCMFIEYDSAYKFRLQDVSVEINKYELIKNPAKEINRLFDVLLTREKDNKTKTGMGGKWRKVRKMFKGAFMLPIFKRIFIEFAKEIDIEKLKPDEGDRYYDMLRIDYDFFGKSLEERIAMRKEIEGSNWIWFEEIANCFLLDRDKFLRSVEANVKAGY